MLDKVLEITREAGELVREGFGKDFSIEYKTNESNLVTEIDKKSEALIVSYIKKNFPTHGILAEEGDIENTNAEYLWVIDPIDGTTNFAHGFPIFAVSVGLQKNGKTICGAVYHVMQNNMFFSELGSGSFCDAKRLKVAKNDKLRTSLLVTGFPYNIDENPDGAMEIFNAMVRNSRGMRRLGSAALDVCYVASGCFEGFWEVNLFPWDICAAQLILEEAGGKATDFSGNPAGIYSKQFICSNGFVHQEMLALVHQAKSGKI
jgi:myo-inositol-1(or 4)-monophosphatase